jgi:haloacid dehalogenase-like hydrolase
MDALEMNSRLPSWREGPTKRALVEFLQRCVRGPEAVPPDERVAAFDNDGTVACEKPLTALAAFLLDHDSRGPATGPGGPVVGGGHEVLRQVATRFAGQTTEQYQDAAQDFLRRVRHPRLHCLYPQVTYRPMLELIALLQMLQFAVFLCTDSSQDFIRVMAPAYGLRRDRIIGSEVRIQPVNGDLVRTATPAPLDDGPGKVAHLWDRTGTRPILAAGNAAGDIEMLASARFGLLVAHDDDDREYAYQDPRLLEVAAARGWTVVSIREDFLTLWAWSE